MVKGVVLLLVVVVFAGVLGCAALPTPIPGSGSVASELYRTRCGSCHAVAHPKRFTARQWESWLPQMERIMQERGAPVLSVEDRKVIEGYLKENAR